VSFAGRFTERRELGRLAQESVTGDIADACDLLSAGNTSHCQIPLGFEAVFSATPLAAPRNDRNGSGGPSLVAAAEHTLISK